METRTRKFSLLFSVNITHGWFDGAGCPFLSLEPADSCRRLLNRKRLIWRRTGEGIQVIGETGSQEPDRFEFVIQLRDPAFFRVTKLDFTDFPEKLFAYSNSPKTNRLSLKKYINPGTGRSPVLGTVLIDLSGQPPKGGREPFVLSFDSSSK